MVFHVEFHTMVLWCVRQIYHLQGSISCKHCFEYQQLHFRFSPVPKAWETGTRLPAVHIEHQEEPGE